MEEEKMYTLYVCEKMMQDGLYCLRQLEHKDFYNRACISFLLFTGTSETLSCR